MGFVENINTAATVITPTVATNIGIIIPMIGTIGTVAGNMTNVNTVATNIVGLNSVVTNLAEVLLANDNAVIATTKAAEALASANAATAQAGIATTKAAEAASSASTVAYKTVSTIAALRAFIFIAETSLMVLGYYANGDGGGGLFYPDALDTTSVDNSGTVIVANNGTRWKRIHSGIIDVKWFGAKGDGINDDTTAIQNALNANKYVYLPKGTYNISKRIKIPTDTKLVGAGRDLVVLYALSGAGKFDNTNWTIIFADNASILDLSGGLAAPFTPNVNQTISGFRITYQFLEGRAITGVTALNCQGVSITNVEIDNLCMGSGVFAGSLTGISTISNNKIHTITNNTDRGTNTANINGIMIDDDKVSTITSSNVLIDSNYIYNINHGSVYTALYGNQSDAIGIQDGTGYKVSNNIVINTNEGIDIYSSDCTIINNSFIDCSGFGVKLIHGASNNRIIGNTIIRSGIAGVTINGGVLSRGNSNNNIVSANHIIDVDPAGINVATSATACIKIDNQSTGAVASNNVFSDNVLTAGVYTKFAMLVQLDTANIGNVFSNNITSGVFTQKVYSANIEHNTFKPFNPTITRAFSSVGQLFPTLNTPWTIVLFQTSLITKGGTWSAGGFTILNTGIFSIKAHIRFPGDYKGDIGIYIGAIEYAVRTLDGAASATGGFIISDTLSLESGSVITIRFRNKNGADATSTAGQQFTYCSIAQL